MSSVDIITRFGYLQHGKLAPEYSSFKGVISTESIIGWKSYTERESARQLHKDALQLNELHDQHGFFGYTSERIGSTKTYTSKGWIENEKDGRAFRETIEKYFCEDGDILWTPVISLKDYMTAADVKLFNESDYAAVLDKILPKFFKATGFRNENMEWWMDHHVNTDNPHVHLSFFEKEKTIDHGKISMKHIETFKKMFWNEVFAKQKYFEKVGKDSVATFKDKDVLKQSIYKITVEKIRNCTDQSFIEELKKFAITLPETGRLQYGSSHMIPYREQLDQLVDHLLHTPEVNGKYNEFSAILHQFDEVRSTSLNLNYKDGLYKTEDTKLRKTMANTILNEIKRCNGNFERSLIQEADLLENIEDNKNLNEEGKYKVIPVAKSLIEEKNNRFTTLRVPGTKTLIKIPTERFTENLGDGKLHLVQIKQSDRFKVPLSKLMKFDGTHKNVEAITYDNVNDYFSDGEEYKNNEKKKVREMIEFADLKRGKQNITSKSKYSAEEKKVYQTILRDYMRSNGFSISEDALIIPIAKSLIKPYNNQYSAVRIPKSSSQFLIENNRLNDIFGSEKIFLATITPEDEFEILGSSINFYGGKTIQADSLNYENVFDLFDDGSDYLYGFAEMIKRREEWMKRKQEWMDKHHDWNGSAGSARHASFAWMNEVMQQVQEGQLEYLYGKELDQ